MPRAQHWLAGSTKERTVETTTERLRRLPIEQDRTGSHREAESLYHTAGLTCPSTIRPSSAGPSRLVRPLAVAGIESDRETPDADATRDPGGPHARTTFRALASPARRRAAKPATLMLPCQQPSSVPPAPAKAKLRARPLLRTRHRQAARTHARPRRARACLRASATQLLPCA